MSNEQLHATRNAETPATRPGRSARTSALALGLSLAIAGAAFFSATSVARADEISDRKAQAAKVEKQVQALNNKAEIAAENYNAANARYDSLTKKVKATEVKLKKLNKRTGTLQTHLNTRATDMYRNGGSTGMLYVLLSARSLEDFESTARILTDMNRDDASMVAELKQTRAETEKAHKTLVASRADAKRQKKAMAENEATVKQQLANKTELLAGLNQDILRLIAEKQAAEEAAARARYQALLERQRRQAEEEAAAAAERAGRKKVTSADTGDESTDVTGDTKGDRAVAWAMKAIGKPYRWGADGPNSFDCSGLMVWAYDHVGVSLPRVSRSQIGAGRRVSRDDLKPGDLVFFGSPIHHVGMYVGGGDFIHAPYSGTTVRIQKLSSHSGYSGACRPYE